MANDLPEFLTVKDLMKMFRCARGTLDNWERSGQLPQRRKRGPHLVGWLQTEIQDHIDNLPAGIDAAPRQLREAKMLKRKITRRPKHKRPPRVRTSTNITDPAELENFIAQYVAQDEAWEKSRG